jgi:O-acetylhomoserine/O-acetylserine sulfhydrylase-like pyridoxal-dependent enzyme
MEALKNLPIGLQNFEKLRKDGYLYVDKTALVHQLVTTGSYYFLSRPRRFGKSMLQSTLHAYFEGRKELFGGLAIDKLEKDWIKYPVLHLDLNLIKRG